MSELCGEQFLDSGIRCGLPKGHELPHEPEAEVLGREVERLRAVLDAAKEVHTLHPICCPSCGYTIRPLDGYDECADDCPGRKLREAIVACEEAK